MGKYSYQNRRKACYIGQTVNLKRRFRQDTRPTLAFFDFDPKGLSMATSLPKREALCLPPMESLEAAVKANRRRNLYSQSVNDSRVHLDRQASNSDIAIAWVIMNSLKLGLDQEHFPIK